MPLLSLSKARHNRGTTPEYNKTRAVQKSNPAAAVQSGMPQPPPCERLAHKMKIYALIAAVAIAAVAIAAAAAVAAAAAAVPYFTLAALTPVPVHAQKYPCPKKQSYNPNVQTLLCRGDEYGAAAIGEIYVHAPMLRAPCPPPEKTPPRISLSMTRYTFIGTYLLPGTWHRHVPPQTAPPRIPLSMTRCPFIGTYLLHGIYHVKTPPGNII